eukprot:647118-Amorphochlora_amoeboformis.AAC.1
MLALLLLVKWTNQIAPRVRRFPHLERAGRLIGELRIFPPRGSRRLYRSVLEFRVFFRLGGCEGWFLVEIRPEASRSRESLFPRKSCTHSRQIPIRTPKSDSTSFPFFGCTRAGEGERRPRDQMFVGDP